MPTASSPPDVHVNAPLTERELDELQALLDRVPPPLEALDVSMLDGFLCGVLVQPVRVPASRWLPHVTDADGRALPAGFDASRLHALVLRRHAELNDAITRRQWFDPWVFELQGEDDDEPAEVDAVYPWVAGFATAMEFFPELMQRDAQALTEPLALLYRHLDPDDLEDADELLAEIDTLEPAQDLSEAVECLVRATLLLADVGRPLPAAKPPKPAAKRHGPAARRAPPGRR
ncbi:MAG: YecA family protein [Rhizobacter sp.]|nr:YecA family protein [Rhizobacter sp.]